jgi:hypothetical protein
MMKKVLILVSTLVALVVTVRLALPERNVAHAGNAPQSPAVAAPEELDRWLAPIALYPDQLLGQMLICAQNPGSVYALNVWLGKNPTLKGTELQDALTKEGFEPSFVTLALFPQVVKTMADQLELTTKLGVAFTTDRSVVFASIQRLRKKASDVGTLKTTAQQEVETKTTSTGEQVIVIEPANPQVVYVPQYNSTTIYTQAPSNTVIVEADNSAEVAAAGMIGFTAGIAMGAAFSNPYYYGPYGWHGGGYMYSNGWDDYYDAREDAREDWSDHREDMAEERGDRTKNSQEQRTERQGNRQENRPESQAQGQQRRTDTQAASQRSTATPSAESRGYSQRPTQQGARSSDAFSGYSSGKSERSASQRGGASRSSSGRSRGGGGGGRRR